MFTGMLQGILINLLPKVPDEMLLNQLVEIRNEMTYWIDGPVAEYDTSYDVPEPNIENSYDERSIMKDISDYRPYHLDGLETEETEGGGRPSEVDGTVQTVADETTDTPEASD